MYKNNIFKLKVNCTIFVIDLEKTPDFVLFGLTAKLLKTLTKFSDRNIFRAVLVKYAEDAFGEKFLSKNNYETLQTEC